MIRLNIPSIRPEIYGTCYLLSGLYLPMKAAVIPRPGYRRVQLQTSIDCFIRQVNIDVLGSHFVALSGGALAHQTRLIGNGQSPLWQARLVLHRPSTCPQADFIEAIVARWKDNYLAVGPIFLDYDDMGLDPGFLAREWNTGRHHRVAGVKR